MKRNDNSDNKIRSFYKSNDIKIDKVKIDFSLRREVFFVVLGAVVGAVTFGIADTVFQILMGLPYYLIWISFGQVVGVYLSATASIIAGISIHLLTSISIGIVIGIFLYKSGILNISKITNGIIYGLFAGSIFFCFFHTCIRIYSIGSNCKCYSRN